MNPINIALVMVTFTASAFHPSLTTTSKPEFKPKTMYIYCSGNGAVQVDGPKCVDIFKNSSCCEVETVCLKEGEHLCLVPAICINSKPKEKKP